MIKHLNSEVYLSHIRIPTEINPALRPMIVMHGVLGNKMNWRGIVSRSKIQSLRQSYLVDMRNHGESDWHEEFTYEAMADDIIRFAD